jgi:hypothetical protein
MADRKLAALIAVATNLAVAPAWAQETSIVQPELPPGVRDAAINPPSGAVVKSQGRFYIWGDAPFMKQQPGPSSGNDRPIAVPTPAQDTLNPSTAPSTEVMRGAVGYVLPEGSYSSRLGSNARIEVGGASATASSNLTPTSSLPNPQILTGWTLGGCTNCGALSSIDYEGREVSVKAASDYRADKLTLTPSVSVFSSRNHQDFVQTSPGNAALDWNGAGAKLGLDTKLELGKDVAFGIGGSYGVAKRDTTLSGLDGATFNSTTAPRVGNAEAKITYKPSDKTLSDFSLDTFAGVSNYDSKAPGLAAPATGAAPSLKFTPSSDFYAGAGATYKFGTQ